MKCRAQTLRQTVNDRRNTKTSLASPQKNKKTLDIIAQTCYNECTKGEGKHLKNQKGKNVCL